MSPLLRPLAAGLHAARLAFLLLGAWAAWTLFTVDHVREFQAGDPSGTGERVAAWLQRVTIESVGFGLLALLLGLVALLVAPLRGRTERAARRFAGSWWLAAGAFGIWALRGGYYAREYLPFLSPRELLMVNLVGFAAVLVGALVHDRLVERLAKGEARDAGPRGFGSAAGLALGVTAAEAIRAENPGALIELAGGGVSLLLSIPLGALLASVPGRGLTGLADRERLLPRPIAWGLPALIALLAIPAASQFRFGPPPTAPEYATLESTPDSDGPNVVYVVVDTLRADALGCYGYDRPTSPFLDSIAASGARFADFSSAAPWTKPSTGTLLTGLYPSRHGAVHHGSPLIVADDERTLAETFQAHGYATAAFVTNPNVKAVFGFDRGFDRFFDSPVEDTVSMAALRDSVFGRLLIQLTRYQFNWKYENDVDAMNRFIEPWIETHRDERFFLYLHYIDPHSPYSPPGEYREQFVRDHGFVIHNERKRLVGRDLYDGEIRYTDAGLQALIETLERTGAWENTLFVLTSDHGEEWYEFDILGHGFSLYQPVVNVPLIVHGPGVATGTVVEDAVEMVDLPATVLDLAGLPERTLGDGRSFADAARGRAWDAPELLFLQNEFGMDQERDSDYRHWAAREGRWKLVRTEISQHRPPGRRYPERELYDVRADPLEQDNLYERVEHEALVERLEEAIDAHQEFLRTEGLLGLDLRGDPNNLDAATRAQLEALGYLQGEDGE
ncbi:MAG: sulfatase [Planctomycetota bacterium]